MAMHVHDWITIVAHSSTMLHRYRCASCPAFGYYYLPTKRPRRNQMQGIAAYGKRGWRPPDEAAS